MNPPLEENDSLIGTLVFFNEFKKGLTLKEFAQWRLKSHHKKDSPVADPLKNQLKKIPQIQEKNGWYQLKDSPSFKEEMEKRQLISSRYWKKLERLRWVFELCPYVRAVSVCNTLAFDHASEESDIDLFIAIEEGKLLRGRTALTLLLHGLGVRRHGNRVAGRLCLSFFVSTKSLDLSGIQKGPFDVYLAYWFKTLQAFSGPIPWHQQLNQTNEAWLKRFFDTPLPLNTTHWRPPKPWRRALQKGVEWILDLPPGDWVEKKLHHWQERKAQKIRSKLGLSPEDSAIVVNATMLKFHNTDRRLEIQKRWNKTMADLELETAHTLVF